MPTYARRCRNVVIQIDRNRRVVTLGRTLTVTCCQAIAQDPTVPTSIVRNGIVPIVNDPTSIAQVRIAQVRIAQVQIAQAEMLRTVTRTGKCDPTSIGVTVPTATHSSGSVWTMCVAEGRSMTMRFVIV